VAVVNTTFKIQIVKSSGYNIDHINPFTPELNLSAQRCLTGFITGDFAS
jgi:hypothetical protein